MPRGDFTSDLQAIREDARRHLERGPITDAYGADRDRVLSVLNDVLATELVCTLRYKRHYFMAQGMFSGPVAAEFLEHANEEQDHADRVAERIVQLQGAPDLNPETLAKRSHAEYVAGDDLVDMVKEDLVAERIAISTYEEIVRWLGDDDVTTRRLMESILEKEEEHADDLLNLLAQVGTSPEG